MNLTTDTFNRLELSAPPNGFANPLAAALILAAAATLKLNFDLRSPLPMDWADWAVLAGLAAAIFLNLREAWLRARRRDWALILDRKAGRVTFIRVRPVRVQPKVIPLSEIQGFELGSRSDMGSQFRYQPRFRLHNGRAWHVPDLWGDRHRIPLIVDAVNRWLAAEEIAEAEAAPEAELQSA